MIGGPTQIFAETVTMRKMPDQFPAEWEEVVDRILSDQLMTVIVLGGPDQGKSTLCRYLLERVEGAGQPVALVDADVGQKDVGPPGTVTLGRPPALFSQKPPVLQGFYFIGAVTPIRHFLPIVVGIQTMVKQADRSFVVVNTTGFIKGPGRGLKESKIEAVRPHAIVAIQEGQELESLLLGFRYSCAVIRLRRSPWVVRKSPERRRKSREDAYRDYFARATVTDLELDRLAVQRGELEVHPGERRPSPRLKGLLCGLCRRDGTGAGLGLLESLDVKSRRVSFLTPCNPELISTVQLGSLYLARTGEELGRRLY
jgi:polynucleotide 5'-hydroxyl-kinase GRC3/NOL9